jgi:hypothetical protein
MIQFALKASGAGAVTVGLLALAFGSLWASRALELVSGSSIAAVFDTLLPFLPIFLIASGAFLLVRPRN